LKAISAVREWILAFSPESVSGEKVFILFLWIRYSKYFMIEYVSRYSNCFMIEYVLVKIQKRMRTL